MMSPQFPDGLGAWVDERYRRALEEYVNTGSQFSLRYALVINDVAGTQRASDISGTGVSELGFQSPDSSH
jgi:hypothetical protein